MKVAVLQSNYIPWKGYFDIINSVDVFCFYDEVKYTKNDWRNRNKIYSKNGLQWITIPIAKDAVKLKISEVNLPEASWQQGHYSTITMMYKRAPFFHQLEPLLDSFYKAKQWQSLSEFNQYSIKKTAEYLGIKTKFINSRDYDLKGDRVERLIYLLSDIGATEYLSGPSAKNYLTGYEHLFTERAIQLNYKTYDHYLPYKQLTEPFEHFVSIVDLIANVEQQHILNHLT